MKLLQKQCPWHPNSKHSAIQCYNLQRTINTPPLDKDKKKGKDKEDRSEDASKVVNVIFGGDSNFLTRRAQKLTP